eukprot:gene18074-20587_t
MILKAFIAYLLLQLVASSLEENSDTVAAELHKRALVPGARIPHTAAATADKGLHLSVTTGTPGVWYPGSGAPFDPKKPISYWTASDSSGQFPSAASENGTVYVSDDYGVTWSARGASRAYTALTSDATGNRLAVAVNKQGVYLSSDRGITWTLANIPDASNYRWVEVVSDHSGQHLTAVGALAEWNPARIYYSHDFGVTWAATEANCYYYMHDFPSVTISQDGQYQYASFGWCGLRSTDYGATWTPLAAYTRLTACNGTGQSVVAVNYDARAIMGSTDYGITWTNFDISIANGMSYSSIVMDTSGLNIVVGSSDPRSVIGSADGGATWSFITPVGGLFATIFPLRMAADASAKHLLIAQELMTTVNPLVTAFLPESVPTAKPTGAAPLGYDSSPANLTMKTFASVKDAQFFLVPANVTSVKVTLYGGGGGNYTTSWWYPGRVGMPGRGGMISSFVPVTPGEVLMVMVGSAAGPTEVYGEAAEGGFNGGGDGLNPTSGIAAQATYSSVTFASPGGNHLQEPTCTDKNPGPLGQGCDSLLWYGSGGGGGYYGGAAGQETGGGGGSSFSFYPIVIEATGVHTGDGYAVLEYKQNSHGEGEVQE